MYLYIQIYISLQIVCIVLVVTPHVAPTSCCSPGFSTLIVTSFWEASWHLAQGPWDDAGRNTEKKRQNFECESSDKIKEWEKMEKCKTRGKTKLHFDIGFKRKLVLDHSTGEGQWNQGHRAKIVKNCHIPQCFPLFKKKRCI